MTLTAKLLRCSSFIAMSLGLLPNLIVAHPLAPSLLELKQTQSGPIAVHWKTPIHSVTGALLRPVLPPDCRSQQVPTLEEDGVAASFRWTANCQAGLQGRSVSVLGLEASRTTVIVRYQGDDGWSSQGVLSAGRPSWQVPSKPQRIAVFKDYAALGIHHLLTGFDHLAFVAGLIVLVVGTRRLLWTITSFTLGHSVTLTLSTLQLVRLPSTPVEIGIALTILVLALEMLPEAESSTGVMLSFRRNPWRMAFLFGLLHGFGFAGALAETGLPQQDIPLALASFNAGLELGQLGFVAVWWMVLKWGRTMARGLPAWKDRILPYTIGTCSVFWICERVATYLEQIR